MNRELIFRQRWFRQWEMICDSGGIFCDEILRLHRFEYMQHESGDICNADISLLSKDLIEFLEVDNCTDLLGVLWLFAFECPVESVIEFVGCES